REETVKLKTLTDDIDQDDDGFPNCKAFTDCSIVDSALSCFFLDCDDLDAAINPFADEVCGNGKDDDCSGGCGADPKLGDATCVDNDHDGVPTPQDCDDNDPCRSPQIKEAVNLCNTKASDFVLPEACLKKLQAEGKTPPAPPFCGDGVDQSCSGGDATCVVDEDCDGFSPPQDCNDKDAKINPEATEKCDGIDNNCNKIIDEGCLPCDVDGDGHALPGATDPNCKLPKDDPDDFDAGIFPGSTAEIGGKEGGNVAGALRGWCNSTTNKNGTPERDIDHDKNGAPASADCPTVLCDVDGDGFARSDPGQGCTPSKPDCDDGDATVFPGAPDKCGDGKAQDCHADKPCAGDKDGDGYLGAPPGTNKNDLWQYDCNDNDAKIHPWATEICDRQDNDCDGLVDEGNPDSLGNLMSTTQKTCTDDGDGACGIKPGTCACSALVPTVVGARDAATRT
ncbi:MAG: putative metal-binding motif-containing protein, partial [Lentisphaeria bacterium]|nr:putative metal-binding motif-containing protein [Lentisphaeria bacterium]